MAVIVAENINVMSKSLGPAMKERNQKPIQQMAATLVENGADYFDLNIGPARKAGDELMSWLVKTVQEVENLPCYLDTSNNDAIIAGLKVHDSSKGAPVINSISAVKERMADLLPLVTEHKSEAVALLYGVDGIPRDENERGVLCSDLMVAAAEHGIELPRLWFDPIVVPVSSQQNQVVACTAFMEMLPMIAEGGKSTCGLSNISNGSPEELRAVINQTYLCMLMRHGLYSAILDGLDKDILAIAKGQRQDLQDLINKAMDDPAMDISGMSKEEQEYVKTVRILVNAQLYSDSWLEL